MTETMKEFFDRLILAGDVAPAHILLWESGLRHEDEALRRWLLGWLLFDHAGVASYLCDKQDFYQALHWAASTNVERGVGRRHFTPEAWRSRAAGYFLDRGLDDLFWWMDSSVKVGEVVRSVCGWPTFGADAGHRLAHLFARIGRAEVDDTSLAGTALSLKEMHTLAHALDGRPLPPDDERAATPLDLLCLSLKWYSHVAGCYKVGQEVRLLRRQLNRFRLSSRTARMMLAVGKAGVLW